MRILAVLAMLSSFTTVGQSDDTLSFDAKCNVARTEFSDGEMLAAAFSDYRVPEGFYEDHAGAEASLYYINTISICQRGPWIELCTDDLHQATIWDLATDSCKSGSGRRLEGVRETEMFFEFRRADDQSPHRTTILFRVHKCSYLDRSDFDPRKHYFHIQDFSGWYQGTLNARPITPGGVRQVGEYMWLVLNRDMVGARVLSSFTADLGTEIRHTMYTIRQSRTANEGIPINPPKERLPSREWCKITLVCLDYRVNKESGKITLDSQAVRTIQALSNPPEIVER